MRRDAPSSNWAGSLRRSPSHERPSKVIVVTLTDGLENASKQYNLDKIGEMIREQRDKYNWDFVFLGANQDAIADGGSHEYPAAFGHELQHQQRGRSGHDGGSFPLCGRSA